MKTGISFATTRRAFSLLEVLAALTLAAVIAVIGIQYLRPAGESGKQRTCDLTRELLQNDVQRYSESTGRMPAANLRELQTTQYSGTTLPACPVTGEPYGLDRSGSVECPTHEATRAK